MKKLFSLQCSTYYRLRALTLGGCSLSFCVQAAQNNFPPYGIIHNSTVTANQTLALGVNPEGHLNTPSGSGASVNANTLNAGGSVGTAYHWGGGRPISSRPGTMPCPYGQSCPVYPAGWYAGTAPGKMWEGWGASAIDSRNVPTYGSASVDSGGVTNVTVKSFVVDSTSIKSTTWINDSSGAPMLEVPHLYGPTSGSTNPNL